MNTTIKNTSILSSFFIITKIGVICSFLIFPLYANCQCKINGLQHSILTEDSLFSETLPFAYAGSNGEQQLWDYSGCHPEGTYLRHFILNPDSAIWGYDECQTHTYKQTADSLLLTREESSLYYVDYTTPRLVLCFPMQYGDSVAAPFYGEGKYCDRMFLRRYGMVSIKADGYGTLIRAEGDTLRDVLRIRHITTTDLRQSVDSIANDQNNHQQEITERYLWFSQDYRYPVFETSTSTFYQAMRPYSTHQKAFRCGISVSRSTDEMEGNGNPDGSSNTGNSFFTHTVSNHLGHIIISYEAQQPVLVNLIVADIMGMMHRSESFYASTGTGQHTIECTGLRHGQYILYVNVNGSVYSNTIVIQ